MFIKLPVAREILGYEILSVFLKIRRQQLLLSNTMLEVIASARNKFIMFMSMHKSVYLPYESGQGGKQAVG